MRPGTVEALYHYLAMAHGWTGLVAQVGLVVVAGAVALGNERPGQRLLTLAAGVQLLVAAFLLSGASDLRSEGTAYGWRATVPGLVAFAVAAGCALSAVAQDGRWTPRTPRRGWQAWVGYGVLAVAFLSPSLWPGSPGETGWTAGRIAKGVVFTPFGVLPHPVLWALAGLALLSGRGAPRAAAWSAVGGLVALGAFDLLAGGRPGGAAAIAVAAAVAVDRLGLGAGNGAGDGAKDDGGHRVETGWGDVAPRVSRRADRSQPMGEKAAPGGDHAKPATPPRGRGKKKWDLK